MVARSYTVAFEGIEARMVEVQCALSPGLPHFSIVGLADKAVSEKIVATIAHMGYPVERNVTMVILKTDNGIIDAPMLGLWYLRLTGQLSSANYYRLNNSKYVFTVESPRRLLWEDRLIMQRTAVDMLVDYFTN